MRLNDDKKTISRSYFAYVLRQNWQHLIFYFILLFLAVILPTAIEVSRFTARVWSSYQWQLQEAENILSTVGGIFLVVSFALALFAGMSALGYVNGKQAVGCFHSFPLTRGSLYVTETLVRFLYYLVCLAVMGFLTGMIFENFFPMTPAMRLAFFEILLVSVAGFALLYAIVLFAAGLSGTALLRFLMTGVVTLLPFVLYTLSLVAVEAGMPHVDIDAYYDVSILEWFCPVLFVWRTAFGAKSLTAAGSYLLRLLLILLPTVGFYLGGFFLHRFRKSESSGTPIIWKPVFQVVKYLVVFTCTLGGACMFGLWYTGKDFVWFLFGGACGMILSFFLVNVILYRSARSLFHGSVCLLITAVVFSCFTSVTVLDVFHLDRLVYDASSTKAVTLSINEQRIDVTFAEKEDLEALVPMLRQLLTPEPSDTGRGIASVGEERTHPVEAVDERTEEAMGTYLRQLSPDLTLSTVSKSGDPDTAGSPDTAGREKAVAESTTSEAGFPASRYETIELDEDTWHISWTQKSNFGLSAHKQIWVSYTAETKDFFEWLLSSSTLEETMNTLAETRLASVRSFELFGTNSSGMEKFQRDDYDFESLTLKFREWYHFSNEERMNSPVVGRISCFGTDGRNYSYDVYADNLPLVNAMARELQMDVSFETAEDVYRYLAKQAAAAFLFEMGTGRTVFLTEDELAELYQGMPLASSASWWIPQEVDDNEFAVMVVTEEGFRSDNGEPYYRYELYPIRPGSKDLAKSILD